MMDKITGDFAIFVEACIAEKFRNAGLDHHGISVERTNDSMICLVRSAQSNEGRKNVTLQLPTPGSFNSKESIHLRELLRRRTQKKHEVTEIAGNEDWQKPLEAFVVRSIRAEKRQKAILAYPGACNEDPWTQTIHPLVKQWLEDEGCDFALQGQSAYNSTFEKPATIDVGAWYFIDGYATCEGIQNKQKDVKLFSNQTDRTVRLEMKRDIPETAIAALAGQSLEKLANDSFVQRHGDLKIEAIRKIYTPIGERVISVEIEPREVAFTDAPEGFDTTWMSS